MLSPGTPLWAQIAPANAASVRAFLAAGFTFVLVSGASAIRPCGEAGGPSGGG